MAQVAAPVSIDDDKKPKQAPPTVAQAQIHGKETEPANEEKVLKEIVEVSEEADREAGDKIRKEIRGARVGEAKPQIPKDVSQSGVVSPQAEASNVLKKGGTIILDVTEDEYKKGLAEKVKSTVVNKNVLGISSLVGMVIWVGRMIKESHKKAISVVFRKKGGVNAS